MSPADDKWFIEPNVPGKEIGYRAIVNSEGETICNPSPMGDDVARMIVAVHDLLAALEPFAECAALFDEDRRSGTMPRSGPFMSWPRMDKDYELTVEDLRNARAAVAKARGEA